MIAIVPARGGSKGLLGKNIKILNGKPMIAYTIETALKSKYITDVIISTDDEKIYKIAIEHGARDTFLRPTELSLDDSLAIDNYIYTIQRLRSEFSYNINEFIVLQPTSPLRRIEDIDGAIELFLEKKADSVISYTEESHPIVWHKNITEEGKFENIFPDKIQNRQSSRPTYYPNGAIFIFRAELIESGKYYSDKSYSYIMSSNKSVDIDTLEDFEYAEYLMGKHSE